MEIRGQGFITGVTGGCCCCLKSSQIPGDHLFLLVGGVAAAAQVLVRWGQEVQRVILEVLVDKREKNLRRVKMERDVSLRYTCWRWEIISYTLTLAKNLISCSCGERSVFPLAAMASAFKARGQKKKNLATDRITLIFFPNENSLVMSYPSERWTPEQSPHTSAAS